VGAVEEPTVAYADGHDGEHPENHDADDDPGLDRKVATQRRPGESGDRAERAQCDPDRDEHGQRFRPAHTGLSDADSKKLKTVRRVPTGMTVVAVLVDPPRPGLVFPRLAESSPLSPAEAADLYAAATRDVVRAVAASGGDLLVNYRPDDGLPEEFADGDRDALSAVQSVVDGVVEDARYEVQVGETFAGRAGNTATHLLEQEETTSVAVVEPSSVFLTRALVDNAAMKLRRSPVVLGPAPGGRVYYAAFTDTIDFADTYAPPALSTLVDRGRDAGHEVDFLPRTPVLETGSDLADVVTYLRARRRAGLAVAEHTAAALDGFDLVVEPTDDGLSVVR
jgi:glycosyltransferase A (GT-A) superfamily protein (DUF2064 family)